MVTWTTVARDQVRTLIAADVTAVPGVVVKQLARGRRGSRSAPGDRSRLWGSGCPGCTIRSAGRRGSLSTSRDRGRGKPVAGPVGDALGVPVHLVNDARAFGLAELRLGAGARRRLDDRVDAWHGHRRRRRGRWSGHPGPRRHGRRDRPPDDRPGWPVVWLRQSRVPRSVCEGRPDCGGLRDGDGRGGGRASAGRRPSARCAGWRTSADTSGSGSPT